MVAEHRRDHPARHAAKRAAADVQAHRQAQRRRFDFLAKIGHGNRRHAAQGHAQQGAHGQQLVVVVGECAQHRHHGGDRHGAHHQRLAAQPLGYRAGHHQRHRQCGGRDRQGETALSRAQCELVRQQRHQRLHAVQQREARKAAEEHGAVAALEVGGAGGNARRRLGRHGRRWRNGGGGSGGHGKQSGAKVISHLRIARYDCPIYI